MNAGPARTHRSVGPALDVGPHSDRVADRFSGPAGARQPSISSGSVFSLVRRLPSALCPLSAAFRPLFLAALAILALSPSAQAAEEFFDRVQEALTWSAAGDRLRARVSGIVDVEAFDTQLPAPGLLPRSSEQLLNPRFTLFVDAQWGAHVYAFLQSRADRGFDPGDTGPRQRLDEYALRLTPWTRRRFNLQLGKFASVVGNWMSRHESWSNPLINAPLPYEHLTGVWDSLHARSSSLLLLWSHVNPGLSAATTALEKSRRLPIIWGPSYATGAAVSGDYQKFRFALEVKNASLSSRPETWQDATEGWSHPTVSARVGYRPNEMWNVGFSASTGPYLLQSAAATLPAGHRFGAYRQTVVGQDIGFALRHLQVWSEIYATRFEIPGIGQADTLAYYVEAKYKFTPQFFGAARWNQQFFGRIVDRGVPTRWGRDVWRFDLAPGYRLTPHVQFKLQYSLQHGDHDSREFTRTLATQFTLRF
jgi:hypothetical protein